MNRLPVPFVNDIARSVGKKPKRFSELTSAKLGVSAVGGIIVIAAYLKISAETILK
jgi:hypothetical protein